jgi:hypothetical protein
MKSEKLIYLTYAEEYSGVYQSQVIDVVNFLADKGMNIRLVALISIRNLFKIRLIIKRNSPNAIVLPMFPKLQNIEKNRLILTLVNLFVKIDKVVARGPLATHLAQKTFNKNVSIIYDGRGANKEEEREYNISAGALTYEQVAEYEKNAILKSEFRIAVSEKLVEYWREEFGYKQYKHTVIPCMLGSNFEKKTINTETITKIRAELGFSEEDIVLVYSGSIAGWQSFEFLQDFLTSQIETNRLIKILFLSKPHKVIETLSAKFPDRIKQKWLSENQVYDYLTAGDYGILFRENTVTNKVASPVKFAEYLSAGLSILISENLGDFSEFVEKHRCGYIITDISITLLPISKSEKQEKNRSAQAYYTRNITHYAQF